MVPAAKQSRRPALRRRVLFTVALGFGLSALASMLAAAEMAAGMGYFLNGAEGYGQFYATYVGLWLAIASLALLAAGRGDQPVLGDVTAMFVLAQPAGRLLAAIPFGLPQGFSLVMCGVELTGGLVLLALRPAP